MNSSEQRELLRLLTENFEYEMKTIELNIKIYNYYACHNIEVYVIQLFFNKEDLLMVKNSLSNS
jgi:hypothetical protein